MINQVTLPHLRPNSTAFSLTQVSSTVERVSQDIRMLNASNVRNKHSQLFSHRKQHLVIVVVVLA